jgi:hypothetical protein
MNDQKTDSLVYHTDAGHGWLEVPADSCAGLDISLYSYTDGRSVYLEEDCDARVWLEHHGISLEGVRLHTQQYDFYCFIRDLDCYEKGAV